MWILIILIAASGSGGGNAVAMHEFRSMEACVSAQNSIGTDSGFRLICVPKGERN